MSLGSEKKRALIYVKEAIYALLGPPEDRPKNRRELVRLFLSVLRHYPGAGEIDHCSQPKRFSCHSCGHEIVQCPVCKADGLEVRCGTFYDEFEHR